MTFPLRTLLCWTALMLQGAGLSPAAAADAFLPPEQAFRFDARAVDATHVEVVYTVADGYHLYRDRFAFASADAGVRLGPAEIPTGQSSFDENAGKRLDIHRGRVVIRVPVEAGGKPYTLTVTSQGCADAGLCYAPMRSSALIQPSAQGQRLR